MSPNTHQPFQVRLGLHGAFWLYSAVSVIGLVFAVVFVPETKGRTLDEMEPKVPRDGEGVGRARGRGGGGTSRFQTAPELPEGTLLPQRKSGHVS